MLILFSLSFFFCCINSQQSIWSVLEVWIIVCLVKLLSPLRFMDPLENDESWDSCLLKHTHTYIIALPVVGGPAALWQPHQGCLLSARVWSGTAGHILHLAWSLKHCWACAEGQPPEGHASLAFLLQFSTSWSIRTPLECVPPCY